MALAVSISIAATGLILAQFCGEKKIAMLDIEVVKETEKAVLVAFLTKDGDKTGETEWLPKKALKSQSLVGQPIYTVIDWFSEHVDHGTLRGYYDSYGYEVDLIG